MFVFLYEPILFSPFSTCQNEHFEQTFTENFVQFDFSCTKLCKLLTLCFLVALKLKNHP